jgi:hypothetical protein
MNVGSVRRLRPRLLAALFSTVAVAGVLAASVSATPPSPASGTILVTGLTVTSARTAGGNTIITGVNTLAVSGTISGPATYTFRQVNHASGALNSNGIVVCSPCTVDGKTGTLVARVEGTGALGPPITFAGHATIVDATGGLEGLHGVITFSQVGAVATYDGSIHFEP